MTNKAVTNGLEGKHIPREFERILKSYESVNRQLCILPMLVNATLKVYPYRSCCSGSALSTSVNCKECCRIVPNYKNTKKTVFEFGHIDAICHALKFFLFSITVLLASTT
uniref:Uncharacterized protein n=1 Tax=Glossina pallidipes TaxID=7398 RepID=A0A1A9ZGY6_GLOPL